MARQDHLPKRDRRRASPMSTCAGHPRTMFFNGFAHTNKLTATAPRVPIRIDVLAVSRATGGTGRPCGRSFLGCRAPSAARDSLSGAGRALLTLGGREAGAAVRAIGPRTFDPFADGGFGQVHVARDSAHRLAVVEHQPDDAGFELVSE